MTLIHFEEVISSLILITLQEVPPHPRPCMNFCVHDHNISRTRWNLMNKSLSIPDHTKRSMLKKISTHVQLVFPSQSYVSCLIKCCIQFPPLIVVIIHYLKVIHMKLCLRTCGGCIFSICLYMIIFEIIYTKFKYTNTNKTKRLRY